MTPACLGAPPRPSPVINSRSKSKAMDRSVRPTLAVRSSQTSSRRHATLVWGGHSCPPQLTLLLNVGRCPRLRVKPPALQRNVNSNVKSGGQECPAHTGIVADLLDCSVVFLRRKLLAD